MRNKTQAAVVADLIRKDLKNLFPHIKFRVRSSTFAGGNSVNVDWYDAPTNDEVWAVIGKYQAGRFNAMIDIYEYYDRQGPTVKYVQAHRTWSEAMIEQACKSIAIQFPGNFPEGAVNLQEFYPDLNKYGNTIVYQWLERGEL